MLKTLIEKELLNNLLNVRFSLAYLICTFLLVGGTANMLTGYLAQKRQYEVENGLFMNSLRDASGNRMVARQPYLMQIFCLGSQKDPDTRAVLHPRYAPVFFGEFKRAFLPDLFPTVDLFFVTAMLISLLIFMLTYDAVAGEREEGTFTVLLASPVPRDLVMVAKWLGGYVSLIIPYVVSWLIIMVVLVFTRGITVGTGDWIRIGGLFAAGSLYIAVIFSLSLMVSVVVRSSVVAIVTLCGVWVVLVVAVPSLGTLAAQVVLRPDGTQMAFLKTVRTATIGWNRFGEEADDYIRKKKAVMPAGADSVPEGRRNEMMAGEYEHAKTLLNIDSAIAFNREESRAEQAVDRLAARLVRVSPAGCFQNAFTTIAGTMLGREMAVRASLEDLAPINYQYEYERRQDLPPVPGQPVAPAGIAFVVHETGALNALAQSLPDLGLLALMGVLFFLVGFMVFLRSDIQ